jgi:hypothetical protein
VKFLDKLGVSHPRLLAWFRREALRLARRIEAKRLSMEVLSIRLTAFDPMVGENHRWWRLRSSLICYLVS